MNTNPFEKQNSLDILGVAARWLLGALFIYMGVSKAFHIVGHDGQDITEGPVAFLKLVHQYDMVSNPVLLNTIAALLPWFEIFCGVLLLAGVAVRGAALMLVVMLIPFTLIVLKHGLALAAANGIPFFSVKFDCGCGTGEVITWHKIAENCGLIVLAAWLLGGRGKRFCTRFSLLKSKLSESMQAGGIPAEPLGDAKKD
jgi:uncharacterized membrane protein YphA (DoxX/SURF4 family)